VEEKKDGEGEEKEEREAKKVADGEHVEREEEGQKE
jgi:hypothetical protein